MEIAHFLFDLSYLMGTFCAFFSWNSKQIIWLKDCTFAVPNKGDYLTPI